MKNLPSAWPAGEFLPRVWPAKAGASCAAAPPRRTHASVGQRLPKPGGAADPPGRLQAPAGAGSPGSGNRCAVSQDPAPRERLQPARTPGAIATGQDQSRLAHCGQRRHLGVDAPTQATTAAPASAQGLGGGQFPQLPSSHGGGSTHCQTRCAGPVDGSRVGRPNHDRAVATKPCLCTDRARRADRVKDKQGDTCGEGMPQVPPPLAGGRKIGRAHV